MNVDFQIKDEVLRYLGHKNQEVDDITDKLIDKSIAEINRLVKVRYIYKFFNISDDRKNLKLVESNLKLSGDDIKNHLDKSKSCVLMALTLGHEVDKKIRYYEHTSMTKAIILDASATAYIEEVCDSLCIEIENSLEEGKILTSRYSPGYGDLPIAIQNDFLSTLNAEKMIGLHASSHSILIPRKSVTAIAGVVDSDQRMEESSCINCDKYGSCDFSKGGKGSGYQR